MVEAVGPDGTTHQQWNDGNLHSTWFDGQLQNQLVSAPGLSEHLASVDVTDGSVHYPISDGGGTWTALLDENGAISSRASFDSFGVPNDPSGTDAAVWGGHPGSPTGLYQARARWLDPTTGRFLSEDPVLGTNPYTYSLGDPVNLYDPTGLITVTGYAGKLSENQKKTAAQHRQGCATASQLNAGVYALVRQGSDVPFYIGRTKNFGSRLNAHRARFGRDVEMVSLARTGDYATMRGLEEFFIDAWLDYLGELSNEIGGVGAKNKKKDGYFKAAERFLKKCGSPR